MYHCTKQFFYSLSKNKFLNVQAKKWGPHLGANRFVAGTDIESVTKVIKELNGNGIDGTVDYLGEFVTKKEETIGAKNYILHILDQINEQQLKCHLSVKLTQLGLDIDENLCLENMKEIMSKASQYQIFVNIDMEDFSHYEKTLKIFFILYEHYENLGTVMQSCLYQAEKDLDKLKDVRIRLVKGAYRESEEVAYSSKKDIDRQFVKLAKKRLLDGSFTSIATHDHHIINELIDFIEENNIEKDRFEFQMLYGFRKELQYSLAKKGYRFCTYIPFGKDWFGYYMRRLAERPQNINLILKDIFYTKDNKVKKEIKAALFLTIPTIYYFRKIRKNNK